MDAQRIGRYRVVERLAEGGMAEVYKVKSLGIAGFEKELALKRILPRLAGDPRFIRSFVDEARIAVELSHRNIVQVFDFGRADGELYLTMELVDGVDLRRIQSAARQVGRAVPAPVVAYLVGEIAAGLDHAHRRRAPGGQPMAIVHCDVSPSNVMVSRDGYVKVLDFGVARATFASALEQRRLRGKPRYMAPEQTRGEPPTAAADVFALGVIAWELCAGRGLFRGADLRETVRKVRAAEVPSLAALRADLPAPLIEVIGAALALRPEDRCSAADLHGVAARLAYAVGPRGLSQWTRSLVPDELPPPGAEPVPPPPSARPSRSVLTDATTRRPRLGDFEDPTTRADPAYQPAHDDLVVELVDDDELPPPPRRHLAEPPRTTVDPPTGQTVAVARPTARRRGVVVARARAADPGALEELTARAGRHGGLVVARREHELDVAFGVDVAGDDAAADAASWARGAGARAEVGIVLGVEIDAGVVPDAALASADALARAAGPGAIRIDGPTPLLARLGGAGYRLLDDGAGGRVLVAGEHAPATAPPTDAADALRALTVALPGAGVVEVRTDDAAPAVAALTALDLAPCLVLAPPPDRRQPFALLDAMGATVGGGLAALLAEVRADATLDAELADARVETAAATLARVMLERALVIDGADRGDLASARVLGRARALLAGGGRPLVLVTRGPGTWPIGHGFALSPQRLPAAEPGATGAPEAGAMPPPGAPARAVLAALVVGGGELARAIVDELAAGPELERACEALATAHLVRATTRPDPGLALALPVEQVAAGLTDDELAGARRALSALLRGRELAGRLEPLPRIAALLDADGESRDAAPYWARAGAQALAAGDAAAAIDAFSRALAAGADEVAVTARLGRDEARRLLDHRLRGGGSGDDDDLAIAAALATEPGVQLDVAARTLRPAVRDERLAEVPALADAVVARAASSATSTPARAPPRARPGGAPLRRARRRRGQPLRAPTRSSRGSARSPTSSRPRSRWRRWPARAAASTTPPAGWPRRPWRARAAHARGGAARRRARRGRARARRRRRGLAAGRARPRAGRRRRRRRDRRPRGDLRADPARARRHRSRRWLRPAAVASPLRLVTRHGRARTGSPAPASCGAVCPAPRRSWPRPRASPTTSARRRCASTSR
ncbi:MAG: serine/threonine-protein kinase [Kofleriaceae bacterium]